MKALRWLTRVGPAFVIAAVVLGPGSVTTMSKMGASHGYAMLWLALLAGALMAGFVTLFMRFGISANKSVLQHCADSWGRWFAALAGISMFYVCTAFQFGNNVGVTTAMSSLLTPAPEPGQPATPPVPDWVWPVVFNALSLAFLFAFRRVYTVLEKMMTGFVAIMLVAFFVNLFYARPSIVGIAGGLAPSLPKGLDWMVAAGLVATTFSIVGAIFQAYLVRARGWTERDHRAGVADSLSGIGMLALISMVIMITSAAVLHPQRVQIADAGDMARQLERSLGGGARVVFCIGLWAAAYSSFIVNAMIGGTLLSDGLGWSDDINSRPAKLCSTASLLIGMAVAMPIVAGRAINAADALVFGQAGTLLAIPVTILATLLIFFRPAGSGARPFGPVAKGLVALGTAVLILMTACSYKGFIAKLRPASPAQAAPGSLR